MKILVTGLSGPIGTAVRNQLEGKFELNALNRRDVAGIKTFRADLADFDAVRTACEGQQMVIHLAAKSGEQFSWEEFRDTNIEGTRNVFEAARQAGVRRVIFASSGATVAGWESEEPYAALVQGRYGEVPESWDKIRHDEATRPNGVYASSKVWGESLARCYADDSSTNRSTANSSGLSLICLRIGLVNRDDRPLTPRHFSVWCSQRDLVRMIECCVEAPPELRFDTFFVQSENRWSYRDLTHPRDVLGFEPMDAAEAYRSGGGR